MDRIKIKPIKLVETRETERGQLLGYFQGKINAGRTGTQYKPYSLARTGKLLTGLKLPDLYYMQSVMKDLERQRGLTAAVKWMYWSLKHQKPEYENNN